MLEFICEWMENVAFYLVILIAVMQMVPHGNYEKYVRFFAGLVLILLLSGPILKLFGMDYQKTMKEIECIMEEEDVLGG